MNQNGPKTYQNGIKTVPTWYQIQRFGSQGLPAIPRLPCLLSGRLLWAEHMGFKSCLASLRRISSDFQKNPRAHKNKIGTSPPPPPKPKIPPPLSAPSPGDDLRSKSAIRLRGQIVRSDSFWGIGCDFSAVTIRLRLRCVLR